MDYRKEYEEALERAKSCLKDGGITNTAIAYIQSIFPELLEKDEDELIDSLLQYLWDFYHKDCNPPKPDMKTCDDWIYCIQKLRKRKLYPEDKFIIQDIINICEQARKEATNEIDYENVTRCIDWLKSLKRNINLNYEGVIDFIKKMKGR